MPKNGQRPMAVKLEPKVRVSQERALEMIHTLFATANECNKAVMKLVAESAQVTRVSRGK